MEIGSHFQANDESHLSPSETQSKKPGGWRAIAYILGNIIIAFRLHGFAW